MCISFISCLGDMAKDKTLDVLKKPVHAVVLKPHHLQELQQQGKLPGGGVVKQAPPAQPLPKEEKPKPKRYNPLAGFDMKAMTSPTKQAVKKTKLRVLHDNIPPIPKDKQPPCHECKTAACCRAFVVAISKEEYESGLYDPYAVELDPKYMKQLRGNVLLTATAASPVHHVKDKTEYYLEGQIGEPCPFLDENNQCSIYDNRPITCRVYTCVGDPRITQKMRDGDE